MIAHSLAKVMIFSLYATICSLFFPSDALPCTQGKSVKQTFDSPLTWVQQDGISGNCTTTEKIGGPRTTFFGNKVTILYLISIELGITDAYPLGSQGAVYHYSLGTEFTWTISWEKTYSSENRSRWGKPSPDHPWDSFSISHFTSTLRWNPHDTESLPRGWVLKSAWEVKMYIIKIT